MDDRVWRLERSLDATPVHGEPATAARSLASGASAVTSWSVAGLAAGDVARVADALGGPGRPAGVLRVTCDATSLTVTFDAAVTPLELIEALVAVETASRDDAPAPTSDAALTRRCAVLLKEPDLDTSRLIETYIEPMLVESP